MNRIPYHGAEQDVFTHWRRHYTYTQRAGTTAKIKRNYRRRERHTTKTNINKDTTGAL
jgi:hypothetical protein